MAKISAFVSLRITHTANIGVLGIKSGKSGNCTGRERIKGVTLKPNGGLAVKLVLKKKRH